MISERAKTAIWGIVLEACRNRPTPPKELANELIETYELIFSENKPESHQETLKSATPKDTSDTKHRSPPPLEH